MIEFSKNLRARFQEKLPGEASHLEMAPVGRPISSLARKETDFYKESAVSVILFPKGDDVHFYLMQRHVYEGAHSGQVSFPGGKKEESDPNLIYTATRETFEEIGVKLSSQHLVGELTSVFIPVSKFNMQSFVFCLEEEPSLVIDSYEVESLFSISVNELLNDENRRKVTIPLGNGQVLKEVPCFYLNEKIVWGATALVLNELKVMLRN